MNIAIVDSLQWVRSRPQQFFASGTVDPIYLLAYVTADVIELGGGTCTIRRDEGWWFVGSDVDWLRHDRYAVGDLFRHVVPAPVHGQHAMRAEIIVNAFAKNASVVLDGNLLRISGEEPPRQVLDRATGFHRALLFSF